MGVISGSGSGSGSQEPKRWVSGSESRSGSGRTSGLGQTHGASSSMLNKQVYYVDTYQDRLLQGNSLTEAKGKVRMKRKLDEFDRRFQGR
ncbi:hypothetical protein MCOR02_012342 [Pyricularia oryzae]|uniref:Uncharacterized protein n=1 Tax=Pyricularia oryzae TaxID=318829 RepID=A0A4P7NB68_PYROR|nr:hypothetical protein MCOR02_012342 [Pyricularia oryzae]KAI6459350.1 hypothetical protein MCOR15_005935 [Pyricularia oryzae]KAI6643773.1 hypothetical protein MCOR14_001821 [Pyricularia oryzae]QBZ58972.1 hypothetical protein PoMZ_03932 [Pyricularia oryzae]